ncbi:MAG: hypothetical protein HC765_03070 [Brachymonas sp.]|nr:hypothetical protein [Brachymonas sp.]
MRTNGPKEMGLALNLCDALVAANEDARALAVIQFVRQLKPDLAELAVRHAILLAFNQQWAASAHALEDLGLSTRDMLMVYLESVGINAKRFGWTAKRLPTPQMLYQLHAFKAMLEGDWRGREALTLQIQQWATQAHSHLEAHDWRDAQFFALMLPLSEETQDHISQSSRRYFVKRAGAAQLPDWQEHPDGRIHLAIAAQDMADERQRCLLSGWLKRVDRSRFAIHLLRNSLTLRAARCRHRSTGRFLYGHCRPEQHGCRATNPRKASAYFHGHGLLHALVSR